MSLAPSPCDRAVLDRARDVVLGRNGVEWPARTTSGLRPGAARTRASRRRRHVGSTRIDASHVVTRSPPRSGSGRDVHELERAGGEPVGEGSHRRQAWHNPRSDDAPESQLGRRARARVRAGRAPEVRRRRAGAGRARELARTAGVEPVAELVQQRASPDPRTYVGKGKLEELKQRTRTANAEVLIVDDELEPAQQRALENALTARVVDRTQLILDIFAQHAKSAEGKLQVELAQLEYNLPRMRGMWQHLERLGGGTGASGRRRHARPRRVAARDRPPDRAPQDLAAQAAAQGARQAPRDEPEGARGAAARRRWRSPATRTSASRRC